MEKAKYLSTLYEEAFPVCDYLIVEKWTREGEVFDYLLQKDFFFIFKATICYTVTFDHFIGIIFEWLSYCSLSQKCLEKSKKLFSELFIYGL